MLEVIVPLIVFATIFGVAYLHYTTRNRERLALIEKGADASIFEMDKKSKMYWNLRIGLLLVGFALGLFLGNLVDSANIMQGNVGKPSLALFFGGLGLLISFLLERKMRAADAEAEAERNNALPNTHEA